MSEFSMLWTHPGNPGDGASAMTRVNWADREKIVAACFGYQGVAPGYLNSLAGTVTGANTVAINTGGAVVDGHAYQNDASLNVNIPSAVGGGNTRIDRIILRCNWTTQTVRVTRIAGTDAASPATPAITQTPGTTYDIPLYKALVNTIGTVTLTDERVMAALIPSRQSNTLANPESPGTNNFPLSSNVIYMGATMITTLFGHAEDSVTVTLPVTLPSKPLVFVSVNASAGDVALVRAVAVDGHSFTIFAAPARAASFSGTGQVYVFWLAIGTA